MHAMELVEIEWKYSAHTIHDLVLNECCLWARFLVQATIYRRLWIGRDGHLDQFSTNSKPTMHRNLYENTALVHTVLPHRYLGQTLVYLSLE